MATLSATNPTLMDLARRTDPDNRIATIVEILNETNEMNIDMTWMEGNLPTGHRTTLRTGIPTPTWRKLYGGVQPTKSTTAQITDNTGMLEAYAEVDKALADLNGNTAEFRLSEDRAHIEGMSQELADTLLFGNEDLAPEEFTGLTPRYNSLTDEIGLDNVLSGGGAGADNTSIWLIVWGPSTIHGIVPKGSTAGLQMTDKGQVTIEDVDGSGGRMEAYRTHYRMDAGLVVRDWRYAVRICNIDKSDLTLDASAGADLIDLMTQAVEIPPNLSRGRAAFYVSKTIRQFLRRQIVNKVTGSTLTMDTVAGKMVMIFDEVPVRRVDTLAADEAVVS